VFFPEHGAQLGVASVSLGKVFAVRVAKGANQGISTLLSDLAVFIAATVINTGIALPTHVLLLEDPAEFVIEQMPENGLTASITVRL